MRRRIAPRAGFTLAEVLAAGGLIAVIVAMTAVVLLASINGFARGARQDAARQLGLSAYDFYRSQLNSSREVAINTGDGERMLSVEGGKILFSAESGQLEPLYPDAMYADMSVRVTLAEQDGILNLRVEVYSESGVFFFKDSAFSPLTLARTGGMIMWPSGGQSAQNPVIYLHY